MKLSGNTSTYNDRNVESGWVAVAVPMNVPCLMSAIDDLTTAIARNLSANIIATSVPSFACTTSLGPSMLTTVPRTRTASPSAGAGPLLIAIETRTAATADARRQNPYLGRLIRSSHAYELLAHGPKVAPNPAGCLDRPGRGSDGIRIGRNEPQSTLPR